MRTFRLIAVLKVLAKLSYYHLTQNDLRLGETLYTGFSRLGGIYIKFLQVLLLRADLFDRWQSVDHLRVYEDVDTEPLDIRGMLRSELGSKADQVVLESEQPFAGGSFGQVYRARLQSGETVVIKALRPSLVRHLTFDLRLISFAVKAINLLKPNGKIDLKMLYREFRLTTLGEIDYRRETAFAVKLHERYKGHPQLVIPWTFAEFSTKKILVQEYVPGISAVELLDLKRNGGSPAEFVKEHLGSNLNAQMEALGFEAVYGSFKYDSIQGDPHPGNVRLMRDNKVGIIDFGIAAPSPSDRSVVLDMIKEYQKFYAGDIDIESFAVTSLRFYAAELVAAIHVLNSYAKADKANAILDELGKSASRTFRSSESRSKLEQLMKQGRLMTVFDQVINESNRYGLRLNHESPNFLRAGQLFLVLTDSLGCKFDVMPNVFAAVIEQVETDRQTLKGARQFRDTNRALEIVAAWLDRVSMKDPALFSKLRNHVHGVVHA